MPAVSTRWVHVTILVLLVDSACSGADEAKPDPPVLTLQTQSGIRFGLWPAKPDKPAPTFFIFGSSIEETLGSAYFRQSGNDLAKKGFVCVSLDLPCHGRETRDGEPAGIAGWRKRCEADDDPMADFTRRASAVLDHLLEEKLADPDRIAAGGTSRGGFSALHFAAAEPRVKCVAAFAPVTDLAVLREFQGAEQNAMVKKLSIENRADDLAGRGVWLIIGDRDDRVGTDDTVRFARRVTAASLRSQKPAKVDLHVVAEPAGHTTPAGAAAAAAEWIDRQIPAPQ